MSAKGTPRPYDARRRRERAEEELKATRRRVIDAARDLFLARGYSGTTMNAIASEAGVALQSVYKAGSSKAELLQRVVEVVVAGDDEDIVMTNRARFQAIADEPEPGRQVEMLAAAIASTQERSAPVQVAFRQAAAIDDAVAANLDAELERRHETFATVIRMIPTQHLRRSAEECTDIAWAVGSSEVFLLLRQRRKWSAERYLEWLTATLVDLLLVAPTQPNRR
jgi:AcrR family transcriptional regulator